MPLEKHCVQPGCAGYPMFGFGFAASGLMRWACRDHRSQIWIGADAPAPAEGGRAPRIESRPPSTMPRQGRLI